MGYQFNPLSGQFDIASAGASQVNSDWNASSGVAQILNKPSLSSVATSGSASDLLTGTLADARLSSNVALLTGTQTFTGAKSFDIGTITASTPFSITQTWNNSATTFTGIKANITDTASNASSLLLDLQVGGTSKFTITKTGGLYGGSFGQVGVVTPATNATLYAWNINTPNGLGFFDTSTNAANNTTSGRNSFLDGTRLVLQSSAFVGFSSGSGDAYSNADTIIRRDAANTLAQRNGTNAQLFRIYNTYTDASNYERGFMRWNANFLEIGTEAGGTGTARDVKFIAGSSTLFTGTAGSGINFNSSVSFSQFITNLGSGVAYRTSASDPTTSNIISGYWQIYRNTTTGVVKLWCNNNGTMVSVALA